MAQHISRTRISRTVGVAIAAAGVGAIALMPATASAAPADRAVPGTSCTVGQVERATTAVSPAIGGYLRNPQIRAEFERIVVLPEPQRRAEVQRYLDRNPDVAAQADRYRPQIDRGVARVIATCDRF
ncbi:MAG: hemophore-related protein [Corynebacteriales bacterium]|nr:hemophore-related protein [Mycobacteriales bacterium]